MKALIQMFHRITSRPDDSFMLLESRLRTALDPVSPNPDFVRGLKHHLLSQWGSLPALPDSNTPILILMVVALVFSGIMFIVVSVRLIFILGSTIALLNNRRNRAVKGRLETDRMPT